MWGRRISVMPAQGPPADASLVRPELLDDLGVIVAGRARSRVRHDLLQHTSLVVVFVVAAPPDAGLVAPAWRAVEPLVHAPQDVDPALVARRGGAPRGGRAGSSRRVPDRAAGGAAAPAS